MFLGRLNVKFQVCLKVAYTLTFWGSSEKNYCDKRCSTQPQRENWLLIRERPRPLHQDPNSDFAKICHFFCFYADIWQILFGIASGLTLQ